MEPIWKPGVTVAAVIERDGRFLVVEEHTDDGLRLNQPAGHLEPGESLLEAVARETLEETGRVFDPQCVVGVYQWAHPQRDIAYVRFAFGGSVGDTMPGVRLDAEIVRTLWMSFEELRDCTERHRSPLVMQCVDDWLAGRRFGLELLRDFN